MKLISIKCRNHATSRLLRLLSSLNINILMSIQLAPVSEGPNLSGAQLHLSTTRTNVRCQRLPTLNGPHSGESSFHKNGISSKYVHCSGLLSLPSTLSTVSRLRTFTQSELATILYFRHSRTQYRHRIVMSTLAVQLNTLTPIACT